MNHQAERDLENVFFIGMTNDRHKADNFFSNSKFCNVNIVNLIIKNYTQLSYELLHLFFWRKIFD